MEGWMKGRTDKQDQFYWTPFGRARDLKSKVARSILISLDYNSANTTNFWSRTGIKLQLKHSDILENFKTII